MQHVSLCLCSLLAATSQFSIPIGQKMQLTGWENANNVRNATCAASKISKVPTQDALLFIFYAMVLVAATDLKIQLILQENALIWQEYINTLLTLILCLVDISWNTTMLCHGWQLIQYVKTEPHAFPCITSRYHKWLEPSMACCAKTIAFTSPEINYTRIITYSHRQVIFHNFAETPRKSHAVFEII